MLNTIYYKYTIGAKTGWTRENNTNTGWWVGYLETNDNTYYFATLLLQNRSNNRENFGSCRKEITKKIFYELGYLNQKNEPSKISIGNYKLIDHVPIVVNDLEKVKHIFSDELKFTIKEGKTHQGIKNFFVKFLDGTYLEFIQPIDTSFEIGRYYTDFQKKRNGATSFAISVENIHNLDSVLYQKNIPFVFDQNKAWKTLEPKKEVFFFIEYTNKYWKEDPKNTAHLNTVTSLKGIYFLTKHYAELSKKFKTYGLEQATNLYFLGMPCTQFKVGKNYLYLIDANKINGKKDIIGLAKIEGICGIELKVNSLEKIKHLSNVINPDNNGAAINLKDYNMFLIFRK